MSESIYPVPAHIKNAALVDNDKYNTMYKQSIDDPEGFWREHGKRLDWSTPYNKVKNTSFDKGHISIRWYEDGQLNASYNCIDRHLATKADKQPLFGKVTTLNTAKISATNNFMTKQQNWQMALKSQAYQKVIALLFTCL